MSINFLALKSNQFSCQAKAGRRRDRAGKAEKWEKARMRPHKKGKIDAGPQDKSIKMKISRILFSSAFHIFTFPPSRKKMSTKRIEMKRTGNGNMTSGRRRSGGTGGSGTEGEDWGLRKLMGRQHRSAN